MFKQTIARVFCFLTVFLLSGNVVLSAVPATKPEKKSEKQTTMAPYVELDQGSTFVAEKDPFEDLDFFAIIPVFQRIVFSEVIQEEEENHFYELSGPHFKAEPIWLLVLHIII